MYKSISIVIPVFNEEEILVGRIRYLHSEMAKLFKEFEIIITENGSKDNTKNMVRKIASEIPEVIAEIDEGSPDYGQALVNGINRAKFEDVTIFELDFMDMGFLKASNALLDKYDLIIGSKTIAENMDQRPLKRKIFTMIYNVGLRWAFNVKLSETHGVKTFKKSKLDYITNGCVTRNAVWPSEFCIRAVRDKNLEVIEIPVTIPLVEIRATRIKAMKRLKKTLDDLMLLRKALAS